MGYTTINEIVSKNAERGQHFFDKTTMMFFESRIGKAIYGGHFFVTSEIDFNREDRRYTIRFANSDGKIETIGEFRSYSTWSKAHRRAKQLGDSWVGEQRREKTWAI